MRAAIYARFSSTLQDNRSIDDQVAICRERAAREGWEITDVFADYAISGAVRDRPGLNAALAAAAAGSIQILLAESLDRVSRDQEDIAGIWKRLQFADCELITLSEGAISEIHIGMTGTMSAMFRKNLADHVRRGQFGNIEAGRAAGGLAYGYRLAPRVDASGHVDRGHREIDEAQAIIVRRIFRQFLGGRSARMIAEQLNREGVPAPSGGKWRASTINGDRVRMNGILQNELYIGQLVFNRTRRVTDPDTRRALRRMRPLSEWKRKPVPHLRIVDDADWNAVTERRARYDGVAAPQQRRPKHLLSGLATCGLCGGGWVILRKDTDGVAKWGCGAHRDGRGCTNNRQIRSTGLEERVLRGLGECLLDPDLVSIYVREYHARRAERARETKRDRLTIERRLAAAETKVARLVAAIADGAGAYAEIKLALAAATADREAALADLATVDATPAIALFPNVTARYREQVAVLREALAGTPAMRETAMPAIRELVGSVQVFPASDGRGTTVHITGRLPSIIALATGEPLKEQGGNQSGVNGGAG